MAGTLVIDTLKASTGVLATQNGMTGIAKAWVNFNGVGSTTIYNSFNVSSVTYNGTGNYTINFTTAFPSSTYSYALCRQYDSGTSGIPQAIKAEGGTMTTTQFQMITQTGTNVQQNSANISATFFA